MLSSTNDADVSYGGSLSRTKDDSQLLDTSAVSGMQIVELVIVREFSDCSAA